MRFSAADDEPSHFDSSATLRIHGTDLPCDDITKALGVAPTYKHRVGERSGLGTRLYKDGAWHFTAPVAEEIDLTEHLRLLWRTVEARVDYLTQVTATVDVFCGYRSNGPLAV